MSADLGQASGNVELNVPKTSMGTVTSMVLDPRLTVMRNRPSPPSAFSMASPSCMIGPSYPWIGLPPKVCVANGVP